MSIVADVSQIDTLNSAFDKMEKLFSSKITNAEKLKKKQKLFDDLTDLTCV